VLLQTHCPAVQHAASFPCLAQQVPGAQQMVLATPLPQSKEPVCFCWAVHWLRCGWPPNPLKTTAARAPPSSRNVRRRGIEVASILATSSISLSIRHSCLLRMRCSDHRIPKTNGSTRLSSVRSTSYVCLTGGVSCEEEEPETPERERGVLLTAMLL
jgi:hypothetical protein